MALSSFSVSLAIVDRLVRVDPGNAGWQHDLAVTHVRIGDVLVQQHDLPAVVSSNDSENDEDSVDMGNGEEDDNGDEV